MTGGRSPEARVQKRELVTFPIACSYSLEERGRTKSLTSRGISLDISEAGICIYTPVHLNEGMLLNVYGEAAWNGARKGSVRWCKMITEDLFRVGVKLLN